MSMGLKNRGTDEIYNSLIGMDVFGNIGYGKKNLGKHFPKKHE